MESVYLEAVCPPPLLYGGIIAALLKPRNI